MPISIQQLYDLPDVSVIEDIDIEKLREEMIADFENFYQMETGESITLYPADKDRLKLNIVANKLIQAYYYIDQGFKMNLLKYATGDYLKHLGALKRTFKQESKAAVTVLRFFLEEAREQVTAIPKGKRGTAGDNIFFATDDYAEIPIGSISVDIAATCTEVGVVGNGYMPGQINVMVDKIPYISKVSNVNISAGGSAEENDSDFREKIFLAPSSYSTAGPVDAYMYWIKQYNSSGIEDVKVSTTEDAIVDIRIILTEGVLPTDAFMNDLSEYLSTSAILPLTDKITISAPEVVEYDLDITYYISWSNKDNVETIQRSAVEAANAFVNWQSTHIGMDINTDLLTEFMRAAGVKRTVIRSPIFQEISDVQIAFVNSKNIIYGGIEND